MNYSLLIVGKLLVGSYKIFIFPNGGWRILFLVWALDNCADDVKFLNDMFDKGLIERLQGVLKDDFVRLPYTDGIKILEEAVAKGHKFEFPVYWGVDLASEHERFLVEEHFKRPVILTDYPKEIKAFYMKQNEDGKTVRAMDVLFPKIGEIIGGSEREADYNKLMTRIEEMHIPSHQAPVCQVS